jgi:hypothetical protein
MNRLLRKMPLMRTCKEVTALVVAREQAALRVHMVICKACPNFERQMLTMRNAMKQWRHYGESD